jgi:hypothetical protein
VKESKREGSNPLPAVLEFSLIPPRSLGGASRVKAKMRKRTIYIVITPQRIFTFGSHRYAYRFYRRVQKLPSMQGQLVEFVPTALTTGRRQFDPLVTEETRKMKQGHLWRD